MKKNGRVGQCYFPNTAETESPGVYKRATDPVLTSGKEEKYIIFPSTLNGAEGVGKLWIYTIHNPSEILLKLAPPGG